MGPPQQWGTSAQPPPGPYPEGWPPQIQCSAMEVVEEPSTQSLQRGERRSKKAQYELGKAERKKAGKKPHSVSVTSAGEIDAGCLGKNAWDSLVRIYVPRILDMSVIDWDKQKPEAVQKLRQTMNHNFEYLENDLSVLGFRNAIKRYLKTERSRLKTHLMTEGPDVVPVHVFPDQWQRLIKYWGTEKQVKKAETMSLARKLVKNFSSVGRKGRAGKEAALVSFGIMKCLYSSRTECDVSALANVAWHPLQVCLTYCFCNVICRDEADLAAQASPR